MCRIPDFGQSWRLLPVLLRTKRRRAVSDNISAFATRRRHWRAGALEQRMPFAFHTDRHSPLTSNPSTLICQRALSWSEYEAIYDALENVFVLVELIGR